MLMWKKGDNFILTQSASGWGIKGLRRGNVGIVGGGGDDVCRVYFPKIKKWLNLDVVMMGKLDPPMYKWSKGKYPNIKCIHIKSKNIVWKKIDENTWENQEKKRKYDFIITQHGKNKFILDIFNAKIKDFHSDKAYILSLDHSTLLDAKKEAIEWL